MAADNFDRCLSFTLAYEGGYVDHPKDPGGATNLGITQATLAKHRGKPVTKGDVQALTKAEAAAIYRKSYWDVIAGDALPAGIDLATFDYGVNSGPPRGAKALQKAARVNQVDGIIGPGSLAAIRACVPSDLVIAVCNARLGFVQSLKTWGTFGNGWARRIGACKATSLTMATGSTAAARQEAVKDDAKAAKDAKKAGGATTGGAAAGGGGIAVDQAHGIDWGALAALGVVAVILFGIAFLLWSRSRARREAADAARAATIAIDNGEAHHGLA